MIGLAVVFGLVGVAVAYRAPPTAERLRDAISELEQSEWQPVSDTDYGNALCFDECTTVQRTNRVDYGLDDVLEELRPVLQSHDLQAAPAIDPEQVEFADLGGDIDMTEVIAHHGDGGSAVYIEARASG